MRKLLGACFALSLIGAAACGGSKKAPANPDNTMNNAGGDMGSGSGTASGSGSGMNPCNGASGGGSGMAPDPCSGAE
jgi:hypothetical protein